MKYVIVHGDGMADWACAELGGRTPLEAARKPNMDRIASCGELGMVATIPQGMAPGSDVGTMTMLGYDPARYHTGRAPIEAASQGLPVGAGDAVFRMNLVSLKEEDEGLTMADFTAGHIGSDEAAALVQSLQARLGGDEIRFYPGVSYRHLMVWRGGPVTAQTTPPHDITDRAVASHLPRGEGAQRLNQLMKEARTILAGHPVNQARLAAGKAAATDVWFWGQGRPPALPTLKQRFNKQGAAISAVDLVRGLGRLAGLEIINVPGATGYLDTDYAAKGRFGLEALRRCDFLLLHIEAPDEAGHMGRADLKVEALERIDELIVGPLLRGLPAMGEFRLLLMPDHATPCRLKTHSSEPVPYALVSSVALTSGAGRQRRYTEAEGLRAGPALSEGYRLIDRLFEANAGE
jgi:2,3-bisphosphoglycerate-independent phosphoglycerate mutase